MNIKAAFTHLGLIIGVFTENLSGGYTVKNPMILVTNQTSVSLVPVLQTMEEDSLHLNLEDILSKGIFTPVKDIRDHYSKIHGHLITVEPKILLG